MSSTPIDSSEMPSPTPIQTLTRVWNTRIAPLKLAGSWDNVGTMIEAPFPRSQGKARTILLTIDLTPKVYRESLTHPNLGLIISYHPPIFSGLKSLTLSNPLQSSLLHLAASGVSVFAPHTSLDAIPGGMNDFLAEAFRPWSVCKPCSPIHDAPEGFEESGMGRIVHLEEGGLDLDDAVARVKKHLGLKHGQSYPLSLRSLRSSREEDAEAVSVISAFSTSCQSRWRGQEDQDGRYVLR
jgi:putative NIF3 family GTP cyclohydrolase 1 type 2